MAILKPFMGKRFKKNVARKLRNIIRFIFGIVIVRFHFGKNPKQFIFMVFGPDRRNHDSKKPV